MLEQLLAELLAIIGNGVVCSFALGALLWPLLWLVHVVSAPAERLDHWLKSKAPQRRYTMADHLRGYAVVGAVFGLIALALHANVGLH